MVFGRWADCQSATQQTASPRYEPSLTNRLRVDWLKLQSLALAEVEKTLAGASLDPDALRRAAALAAEGAQGYGHNDFKIELMQRVIVRAIETTGARA